MRTAVTALLSVAVVGWVIAAAFAAAANGTGSDIVRQWVVCQYLNSGQNPYPIAKDVLVAKYGARNPSRAKVYAIPREVPAQRIGEVPPNLGPPEATYPPPAVALLALTVGFLPEPNAVLWVWFAVNLMAVTGVTVGLARWWPVSPGGRTASANLWLVLSALLLFPATYSTMQDGQFSLLVLGLLLVANTSSVARPLRGLALGIALLKPSIALPFVFLPLVRREWRVLLAAVAVQMAASAYAAVQTGELVSPFRDWLVVAGFFLQGMYTIQDWLNIASPGVPWVVTSVSLGLLALCGSTLAVARHLPCNRLFAIAAVTSVFWTYHGPYDFVMLLPVLLPLIGWSGQQPGRRWSAVGLALFAVLAVALTPTVYGGDGLATRIIRWAARAIVIGLFVWEYLSVYRCVFRLGNTRQQVAESGSGPNAVLNAPSGPNECSEACA